MIINHYFIHVTYSYFIERLTHLRVLQYVPLDKNEKPITKIKKKQLSVPLCEQF